MVLVPEFKHSGKFVGGLPIRQKHLGIITVIEMIIILHNKHNEWMNIWHFGNLINTKIKQYKRKKVKYISVKHLTNIKKHLQQL